MPRISDSISKIDEVICRRLDNIDGSTRGAVSQDILEQLMKLVNHTMLIFYSNNSDIPITEENISKATEFAQTDSRLSVLYKFSNYLQVVTTQFTLDENGSERLMLKYYKYLLQTKNLLNDYYGIKILHNLDKFPLRVDNTLQEYYAKISEKIENYPIRCKGDGNDKYYIQKINPLFVNGRIYNEVTFTPVDDRKNRAKTNRVIAFTKLPIIKNYASKFHLVYETIDILGTMMPILIIDGWEVSIRDCEFQNFISLIDGQKKKVPYREQNLICEFITNKGFSLNDLMDFPDEAFIKLMNVWKTYLKTPIFIPILEKCRNIIQNKMPGENLLRYLLFNMNNVIIKNQRSKIENPYLSNLYFANGCIQFDSLPFNRSPLGHNPKLGSLFNCIPITDKKPELFARFIRNNTESRGKIFTDINQITNFKDINKLIDKYNNSLWFGHKPRSNLMLDNNQIFINEYKIDTCKIIKALQKLSENGDDSYHDDVDLWLMLGFHPIDSDEKRQIISRIFSNSMVGVIYGSAGVGKSTLINHVSHFLNDKDKLYLTQTNPAKENLIRKIDCENTTFSTIASFLSQDTSSFEYDLLVIDECSTVSNRDMVAILEKASFNKLLLVGDTYQIDSILFGNWFSLLRYFLPDYSVFELLNPYRTKDKYLLELWDKVRNMDETSKEIIERESYSLKVDATLLSTLKNDEVILCLNYDGLYGINNINRFLQESNPNPAVSWGVHQYKINDPILFLDTERFHPIIHNNMKGIIRGIEIVDKGEVTERIQFDIEIQKKLNEYDVMWTGLELVDNSDDSKSIIRFCVNKLKSVDEDDYDPSSSTIIPFQIAYAVSIHKAQGLEYNSVKIVITDEVEELVTHNIFYTAITRAREKLKIYWTPEVEEKVINRIKPRDISNDVEILKNYLSLKEKSHQKMLNLDLGGNL